ESMGSGSWLGNDTGETPADRGLIEPGQWWRGELAVQVRLAALAAEHRGMLDRVERRVDANDAVSEPDRAEHIVPPEPGAQILQLEPELQMRLEYAFERSRYADLVALRRPFIQEELGLSLDLLLGQEPDSPRG